MEKITIELVGEFEHADLFKKIIHKSASRAAHECAKLDPENSIGIVITLYDDDKINYSFTEDDRDYANEFIKWFLHYHNLSEAS